MKAEDIFEYICDMVLGFFYPPRCSICERYIENRSDILCEKCSSNILDIDCSYDSGLPLKEIWRLTKYKGGTQRIIIDVKFNKKMSKLPAINKILQKVLSSSNKLKAMLKKIDVAIAVPLHVNREQERGFNQVELFFSEWLNHQNIAMERLILRDRDTDHLYDKNRQEREKEVGGAFSVIEGAEAKIKGKKILLLDDIFTTGTTMGECAKVLKSAGAAEVYGIALASDYD